MNEHRKVIINLLPNSDRAWEAIGICGVMLSIAWIFNGFSGCAAREAEARANVGKAATEMVRKP